MSSYTKTDTDIIHFTQPTIHTITERGLNAAGHQVERVTTITIPASDAATFSSSIATAAPITTACAQTPPASTTLVDEGPPLPSSPPADSLAQAKQLRQDFEALKFQCRHEMLDLLEGDTRPPPLECQPQPQVDGGRQDVDEGEELDVEEEYNYRFDLGSQMVADCEVADLDDNGGYYSSSPSSSYRTADSPAPFTAYNNCDTIHPRPKYPRSTYAKVLDYDPRHQMKLFLWRITS